MPNTIEMCSNNDDFPKLESDRYSEFFFFLFFGAVLARLPSAFCHDITVIVVWVIAFGNYCRRKTKYATMGWLQCIDNGGVGQWNWRRNEINETFYEPINEINHHDMVPNNICHTFVAVGRRTIRIGRLERVDRTWSSHRIFHSQLYAEYLLHCFFQSTKKNNIHSVKFREKKVIDKWTLLCVAWERRWFGRQFQHFIFAFERSGGKRELIHFFFFIFRSNNKTRHIECERRACVSFIMVARVVINEF